MTQSDAEGRREMTAGKCSLIADCVGAVAGCHCFARVRDVIERLNRVVEISQEDRDTSTARLEELSRHLRVSKGLSAVSESEPTQSQADISPDGIAYLESGFLGDLA